MANSKYLEIHNSMDAEKWYTAKELGIAPATMTALVNRGLAEKTDTSPRKYKKVDSILAKILIILQPFEFDYFTLYKSNEKLGMLCSLKNEKVLNCWEEVYDLENVYKIWVSGEEFYL